VNVVTKHGFGMKKMIVGNVRIVGRQNKMDMKKLTELLIKRHKSKRGTNIIIVGPSGCGLDNLCVSIGESVSKNERKIKFKDKNVIFKDEINHSDFAKFKNDVIIHRADPYSISSTIAIHKKTVLNLSISRKNNNIFMLRDMRRELHKSSLLHYFDYKIIVASEGEIFIEDLRSGEAARLVFDLRKPNKRAESLRYSFLEEITKEINERVRNGQ